MKVRARDRDMCASCKRVQNPNTRTSHNPPPVPGNPNKHETADITYTCGYIDFRGNLFHNQPHVCITRAYKGKCVDYSALTGRYCTRKRQSSGARIVCSGIAVNVGGFKTSAAIQNNLNLRVEDIRNRVRVVNTLGYTSV